MQLPKTVYQLEKPDRHLMGGVILLPGATGNSLKDSRYNLLSGALTKKGFCFLRLALWKNPAELNRLCLNDIYTTLDSAIAKLEAEGCNHIGLVGKSLGGGVLLTYNSFKVNAMVVWAPAIGADYRIEDPSDSESTVHAMRQKKFSELQSLQDIKINKKDLKKIRCPVLLIQGTDDVFVKRENSIKIYRALPNARMRYISGAGHSYEKKHEISEVVSETVSFFTENLK